MPGRMRLQPGQTLVELLATLAIVAVIAAVAAPAFAGWLLDIRRDAAVVTSLHAVHVARQYAAVRGDTVSLCGRHDDRRCSGTTDWSQGLLVASSDGQVQRDLPVSARTRLRSNRSEIRFEAGTGHATPATLSVCDRRGLESARAVIVSRSGRPRATPAGDDASSC